MRSGEILRWFGRNLESEVPLSALEAAAGAVDARLTLVARQEVADGRAIFRTAGRDRTEPWLVAFEQPGGHRLRCTDVADFDVESGGVRCRLRGGSLAEVEMYFLGLASALWLERAGSICLHASAVEVDGAGIGFLGYNRAGKSSLAASLLAAGARLLTDDLLALDPSPAGPLFAQPSYPQMRLWPTTAVEFVDDAHDLEPVHPQLDKRRVPVGAEGLGSFSDRAVALRALVLPRRGGEQIAVRQRARREAVIELVRHSFLGALGEAAIGADRRLERLVDVAARVPIFDLEYPNGLERLPEVREVLRGHLGSL